MADPFDGLTVGQAQQTQPRQLGSLGIGIIAPTSSAGGGAPGWAATTTQNQHQHRHQHQPQLPYHSTDHTSMQYQYGPPHQQNSAAPVAQSIAPRSLVAQHASQQHYGNQQRQGAITPSPSGYTTATTGMHTRGATLPQGKMEAGQSTVTSAGGGPAPSPAKLGVMGNAGLLQQQQLGVRQPGWHATGLRGQLEVPPQQQHSSSPGEIAGSSSSEVGGRGRAGGAEWMPPGEQLPVYESMFISASHGSGVEGTVSGRAAVQFFTRSGLPKDSLKTVRKTHTERETDRQRGNRIVCRCVGAAASWQTCCPVPTWIIVLPDAFVGV